MQDETDPAQDPTGTDATDGTDNRIILEVDIGERLLTLQDGIATANRAAIANHAAIRALRTMILLGFIIFGYIILAAIQGRIR